MAYLATRGGPSASAPSDGSRTMTIRESQPGEEGAHPEGGEEVGRLRLRAAPRSRPRVVWREDVVDNEGAGKKSSKICCIYHKPKAFDESSSEESSDSDSDSGDDGRARPVNRPRNHHHHHGDGSPNGQAMRHGNGGGVVHELESESDDVNVYERQPKKPKGKAPQRT
ncbi:hypothetical protein DAEQUDRAFT_812456 [Daedalea quercina L-15889]|uniref:Type 1 phosphatases regulator n=1 Tax=Daedalea quercina L-15889 TaxID=1314783 RepID=A0A165P9A2_9APHY|nr:hypothetical protein DAEQUDRAFT_812456 [Daedalea quercina L-15889]